MKSNVLLKCIKRNNKLLLKAYISGEVVPKKILVYREGKPFWQTVYINPNKRMTTETEHKPVNINDIALKFRMEGFTPDQGAKWYKMGFHDPEEARDWRAHFPDPMIAKQWKDANFDVIEAREWKRAGWSDPQKAKKMKEMGYSNPKEALRSYYME